VYVYCLVLGPVDDPVSSLYLITSITHSYRVMGFWRRYITLPFTRFFTISDLLQVLYPSLPEFIMSFPKYFIAFTRTDPAVSEEEYRSLAATILRFPKHCASIYPNEPFLFQGVVLQFTASDLNHFQGTVTKSTRCYLAFFKAIFCMLIQVAWPFPSYCTPVYCKWPEHMTSQFRQPVYQPKFGFD